MNTEEAKFYEYSKDFFNTASSCIKVDFFNFSPTPYYLYCHSIELSLKSILLSRTETNLKTVKKLGHDLNKILKEIKDKNILTKKDLKIIRMANSYYNSKGFEYYDPKKSNGDYSLLIEKWHIDDLHNIAKKLLDKIKK